MATYRVGAARELPISPAQGWDGSAARDSIFSWAGFPDHPSPSKAERGFLCYEASDPTLKGSYKLPFARVESGKLVAVRGGLQAAASRLPQTDIPDSVKSSARAVLDAYFARINRGKDAEDDGELLHTKSFETVHEKIDPASELVKVAEYALRDVGPDDVYTGRVRLANDQYDRSHERFPVEYLERFAATLPGKSLMPGHDYKQLPLGRFYAAAVNKDPDGTHWLDTRYYVDAKNEQIVRGIELGIYKHTSIGYAAGRVVCDLCAEDSESKGKGSCSHRPGREYGGKLCRVTYDPAEAAKAEAREGSLVYLGCQYGAATAKGVDGRPVFPLGPGDPLFCPTSRPTPEDFLWVPGFSPPENEETSMLLDEAQQKELQDDLARLKAREPLVTDGERYRARLTKNILERAGAIDTLMERAGGKGAKRAFYEKLLARMDKSPAEELEALEAVVEEELAAQTPTAGTMQGQAKGADHLDGQDRTPRPFDPTRPANVWRS